MKVVGTHWTAILGTCAGFAAVAACHPNHDGPTACLLDRAPSSELVDTLITFPHKKLLSRGDEDISFVEAFLKADEVIYLAI